MRRIFTLFLSACLLLVFSVPLASATENNEKVQPMLNERIIDILERNNINFQISNGNITLVETSPEFTAEVNELLVSEFNTLNNVGSFAVSYPTPYQHMPLYDIYDSKKFQAATKVALGAAVVEWAKNKFIPDPYKISAAAIGGFAVYYFVNTDKEDLYFSIKYFYRELGSGFFDGNGTFIGDYAILKEIRVTKNSNNTGGSIEHDSRRSSIIEPWF